MDALQNYFFLTADRRVAFERARLAAAVRCAARLVLPPPEPPASPLPALGLPPSAYGPLSLETPFFGRGILSSICEDYREY
jgi:hypothetical protein